MSDIVNIYKEIFPNLTQYEGCILWGILKNKTVKDKHGKEMSGTFRYIGDIISQVTGEGDYLTYYMSDRVTKMMLETIGVDCRAIERRLLAKLENAGVTIEEYQ